MGGQGLNVFSVIARIGSGSSRLAGCADKFNLGGNILFGERRGTREPGSREGVWSGSRRTARLGFTVTIFLTFIVDLVGILGKLENLFLGFGGGGEHVLRAGGAPATGAGFLSYGLGNLVLPAGGLLSLTLVVVGLGP